MASIHIPYKSRSESLVDVAGHARRLDSDDRKVTQELVLGAQLDGLRTAGELVDRLKGMSHEQRRELLNTARQAVGLPPAQDAPEPSLPVKLPGPPPLQATTKLIRRPDGAYDEVPLKQARWGRNASGLLVDLNWEEGPE